MPGGFVRPCKLRTLLVDLKRSHEQIIDDITIDELLAAGFDARAREKAQALVTDFRAFIEANRDELEAIQVLYSRPYREGLRFGQVKALSEALKNSPIRATPGRIWTAFETTEPDLVRGRGGKDLVDLIALVRHAIDPAEPLVPFADAVGERYYRWVEDQGRVGVAFTIEQRQWLDAIGKHIAKSVRIEPDDFEYAPFNQFGGLGRAYDLFGDRLPVILEDLNRSLAA